MSHFYILLIVFGFAARLILIAQKNTLEHDEAISYLAATGHQAEYQRQPLGEWRDAHEWQRLIHIEDRFVFNRIADDLAHVDAHPPLYFWLLHLWIQITGVTVWSGSALNVLVDAITAVLLWRLARRWFGESALAVVTLWVLSPIAIQTSIPARQYPLFTLWVVALVWAADGTLLIPIALAGLLTHYYFVLALLGLVIGARAGRIRLLFRLGIAGLVFMLLFPGFYLPFERHMESGFNPDEMIERLAVVIGALLILAIPLVSALIGPRLLWRKLSLRARSAADDRLVVGMLIGLLGGQILLYMLQISPKHALMDARYLGPVWPFVALGIGHLLARKPAALPLACLGLLLLIGFILLGQSKQPTLASPDLPRIVLDNPAEGLLLPVIIHLDGDVLVFVDHQDQLLAEPDVWLPEFRREGGLVVSLPGYEATREGQAALIALLDAKLPVEAAPRQSWQADSHRRDERIILLPQRDHRWDAVEQHKGYRKSNEGKGE